MNKNAAYSKATDTLKAVEHLPKNTKLRQNKYLNNIIESDQQFIKQLVNLGMGFGSFQTAWRTLRGYETMNMIRKGQIQGVTKGDVAAQVNFVAQFFEVVAYLYPFDTGLLSSISFCNTTITQLLDDFAH